MIDWPRECYIHCVMFEEINKQYPDYHFRYLLTEDYHHGVFQTLGELTSAPKPMEQDFLAHLQKMKDSNQKHVNIVGVQKKSGRVIAFGTILICNGSYLTTGKIQNIVTSKAVRGKGLGKCIILILKEEGWREGCDKISLFCQQKNVQFYQKLGFTREGTIYACYKK